MQETVSQYITRILGLLGSQDPVEVLAATPARLDQVLAAIGPEKRRVQPGPGKWSPAEIAVHLAEVEMVVGVRVRLVVGTNGIGIQGFDQDAWAERYGRADYDLALETFHTLRRANLALYRGLTPGEWEHYGMHSERGKETARRIVEMSAGHDINHLRQLEALAR